MLIIDNFIHADLHPGNIVIQFCTPYSLQERFKAFFSWIRNEDTPKHHVDPLLMDELYRLAFEDSQKFRDKLKVLFSYGYEPRLVFLDSGLVAALEPAERANFLALFNAVANFDGYFLYLMLVINVVY